MLRALLGLRKRRPRPDTVEVFRGAFWHEEPAPPPSVSDIDPGQHWVYVADTLNYQLRDVIETAMREQGLDRDTLAAKSGLRRGRVAQLLIGRMTLQDAAILAAALGISLEVTAKPLQD